MRALCRALVLSFGVAAAGHGATIPVTTTADELNTDGDCSLREAVVAANTHTAVDACPAGSGDDVIQLPVGTYPRTLTGAGENAAATGDLDLTGTVTIVGANRTTTIIEGDADDRLFEVRSGAVVRLESLTLRNATPTEPGAVAINRGTLTIHDCTIGSNTAATTTGGALYSLATTTLTISDSVLAFNTAGTNGGALANGGTTTITHVTFQGNGAGDLGGAIYQSPNGSLTIDGALFLMNDSGKEGGAIYTDAPTTITGTNFYLNSAGSGGLGGGALWCSDTVALTHSLVAYNSSDVWGGGISTNALCTLDLTNVTIHGNEANASGGGLRTAGGGTVTLTNCTVTGNQSNADATGVDGGGGIDTSSGGTVTLRNTVVADNVDDVTANDCKGTLTSEGYNLLETTTGCTMTSATGDVTGVDPQLDVLTDNGGPTETRMPSPTSPLVEAGNPATPGSGGAACAADDQRGYVRPAGTTCDIGAVERGALPPSTTTTTTTTSTTTTTTTTLGGATTTTTTSVATTTLPAATTTTTTMVVTTTLPPPPPTTTTLPPPLCAGGAAMQGATLRLRRLGGAPGDERLVVTGALMLPPGTPPALTPQTTGVQVLIEDQGAGGALVDLTARSEPIPPGARGAGCHPKDGWKGTTWVNRSGAVGPGCRAGSAQGVRRLELQDRRGRGRGIVFTLKAQGRAFPRPLGPVRVTLVLGAQAGAGAAGVCGTHVFAATCTSKGATYRCR